MGSISQSIKFLSRRHRVDFTLLASMLLSLYDRVAMNHLIQRLVY